MISTVMMAMCIVDRSLYDMFLIWCIYGIFTRQLVLIATSIRVIATTAVNAVF